jgi:hypothetical protein
MTDRGLDAVVARDEARIDGVHVRADDITVARLAKARLPPSNPSIKRVGITKRRADGAGSAGICDGRT